MVGGILLTLGFVAVCAAMIAANRCFKRADEPLSDWADGDIPAIPDELKVSHHGTVSSTEA